MTRNSYVVTLQPAPGVDGLRALRAALKILWRQHGLRCRSIREAPQSNEPLLDDRAEQRIAQIAIHNGE